MSRYLFEKANKMLNKKENEKQIEKFLKTHEEFSLVDEKTIFSDTRQDGFYMAKLVRK